MTALRPATRADAEAIALLIHESARALSAGYYTPRQVESALRFVFGVDSQLIADGTYYVVEGEGGLSAAGGWSRRRTLFGGDQAKAAIDAELDPAVDAARIRAFFVHPDWARRGLARRLFDACESAARAAGFTRFELMGTMPGVPLYMALGFSAHETVDVPMPDGTSLPCVRMTRAIADAPPSPRR